MPPKGADKKTGEGSFKLPNGDKYDGEYLALKKQQLYRHGFGIYTTWDGQKYAGEWNMDKLLDSPQPKLTFADKTCYEGLLTNQQFNGAATVTFSDNSKMCCTFSKNVPSGEILFIDPNKRNWRGEIDGEYCQLFPDNHFYYNFPIDIIPSSDINQEAASKKSSESQ